MIQDPDNHVIPTVSNAGDTQSDEDQFQGPSAAPSVTGEEDPFSGDATNSESPDIDDELAKVGLQGDTDNQAKPINLNEELDDQAA